MNLALGGSGADGAPSDEVCEVLWGNRIEEFDSCGNPESGAVQEELATETEALIDVVGSIEVWVIDKSLKREGWSVSSWFHGVHGLRFFRAPSSRQLSGASRSKHA